MEEVQRARLKSASLTISGLIVVVALVILLIAVVSKIVSEENQQRERELQERRDTQAAAIAAKEDQTPYWCSLAPKPGISGYIVQTIGLPRMVEGPVFTIKHPGGRYGEAEYVRDNYILIHTPQGDIRASDTTTYFCATNKEALTGK